MNMGDMKLEESGEPVILLKEGCECHYGTFFGSSHMPIIKDAGSFKVVCCSFVTPKFRCDWQQTGAQMWKRETSFFFVCQKHARGQMCGETVIHREMRPYADTSCVSEIVYGQVNQLNFGRGIIWISRKVKCFIKA